MNLFQFISIIFFGILLLWIIKAHNNAKLTNLATALWSIMILSGILLVISPTVTKHIAHTLGIGRGADLIFYIAIFLAIGAFFSIHLRLRRFEREITQIVRHIAIRDQASSKKFRHEQ